MPGISGNLRFMTTQKKAILTGGGLAGFALGCCLAWIMSIVQMWLGPFAANSSINMNTYYPPIGLTVFVVIATCSGVGIGIGMMAAALIRDTSAASPDRTLRDDPEAAPTTTQRNIWGFAK
jgi:hypothetical protein